MSSKLHHPCPGAVVTQRFSQRHPGLDLALYRGAPILAAETGVVTVCQWDNQGYGNRVDIEHMQIGVATRYAHLDSAQVQLGERVERGQIIGYMGNTGNVIPITGDGTHLHYEVIPLPRDWDSATSGRVDPEPWLVEEQEAPMSKHILSLHTQRQCELGTEPTETIRNSALPWFKAMDPDTWHAPVNVMFPGKRVVIRLHLGGSTGDKREHEFMRRGAQGAREYIALLQPRIDKCIAGGVRDFEGPNEIHPNGADNPWDAFVEFQWELARYYVGRGCRYWALSLGVGWMPNIADIVRFKDLLAYCAANGGGLAVHEYGCPSVLDGNGYWTMRIRKTLDALYAAGVAQNSIPVIITEAGITWALLGEADTGWNSHPGWVYPAQYGLPEGIMTRERIWRQMLAYEERIMAEVPEVQMINWFTTLPFGDWITFDVNTEMVGWVCGLYTEVVEPPADLEQIIGDAIQQHIIPLNPNAALERAGMALGLLPASDEVRDVEGYVAQAFRKPGEEGWQEIAYCADGDWGNINWFRRAN